MSLHLLSFFVDFLIFCLQLSYLFFFFFNDTATTEIYTLSLHDALPIYGVVFDRHSERVSLQLQHDVELDVLLAEGDRKSTRLNSSHGYISYAVFCLKKKKKNQTTSNTM